MIFPLRCDPACLGGAAAAAMKQAKLLLDARADIRLLKYGKSDMYICMIYDMLAVEASSIKKVSETS